MTASQSRSFAVSAKTGVTVQIGILASAVVLVFQVGRLAERADRRLVAIEDGVKSLQSVVEANGTGVQGLTSRVDAMDEQGTQWCRAVIPELSAKVDRIDACLRSGRKACR